MTATRAVVLARGLGTRMRSSDEEAPLTDEQRRAADAGMKAMMPIGGRPFLDYVLSALADAGLLEVAIVVAPDHEAVRAYYTTERPPARVSLDLLVQREPRGTADAVLSAEAWAGDRPFVVLNGDNLYPAEVLAAVAALDEPGLPGFDAEDLVRTSNFEPARVRAFAIVEADSTGHLKRIVEKPSGDEAARAAAGAFVSMNCWRFDRRIFDCCRDVAPSSRGELELPNAVGLAASRGIPFKIVPARGPVLDLSQRADAAALTRRLAEVVPRP